MAPHQLACMYKLRDRINQLDSIPTRYRSLLEHRLVIACSEFKRQDRGEEVQSLREIRTRHAEKRAHQLYLDVLDEDPQIFIPFLLVVKTNTACVKYNLELFRQHHDQRVKIRLGNADKVILEDIARRHGIGGSIAFQKLIHALFPATPRTATAVDGGPTTTADGPKPWRFNGAPLDVVRSQFAVGVFEAICKAPARCENVQFSTRTTTGSVWMDLPSVDKEDCILWLNIGDVDLFEKALFPAGCRIQESGHDGEHTPGRSTYIGSDGRYSLQRACCAAATLIFGSQLYEAIDTSRLRTWERETAGLTDTTDCITIEVHATHELRYGTLRLHLEFLRGLRIAQRLFAIPNASDIQANNDDNESYLIVVGKIEEEGIRRPRQKALDSDYKLRSTTHQPAGG